MIKSLMAYRLNNSLQRLICRSFALSKPEAQEEKTTPQLKPYQILLRNNIENIIKLPSPKVLENLRSRSITKIIASNHNIDDPDQVLEAHVECLYALIYRIEPSIEAISMFAEAVYRHVDEIRASDITCPALLNLLKPTILVKLVKISQSIDSFYNQAFRSLISALIVKLLEKSSTNQVENLIRMQKLKDQISKAKKGSFQLKDTEGNVIKIQNIEDWQRKKIKEINQAYRFLNEIEYWNCFEFVLSMEYYQDDFLLYNMSRLEKSLEKDVRTIGIKQIMVKIKSIVQLHRFKNHKQVGAKGLRSLFLAYNKLVEQYFKLLSQQSNLLQIINSDEPIVQVQLLTSFLTQEHYDRAKKVYLQIFKSALNIPNNGILLIDVKRLRGFFEIILILYGHEDTKDIHDLLTQLEKVMIMYPLEKFDKLEAHCYVCDKFGFKSDYFAEKFFKILIQQKQKLQRNRGHLHHVHQVTREINLARKFYLYTKIPQKLSKQQLETATKISSTLFDPNVWFLFAQTDYTSELFLTATSFSNHLYFLRTGIPNLTTGTQQRRKIQKLCAQIGLKNLNKNYRQIMEDLRSSGHRFSLKLDHLPHWRHNPYARMSNLLELANCHHEYLQRVAPQDAENFIQQFLTKTLGSTLFYNTLKQRFAYPGMLHNFIQLMERADTKSFPIQNRDLEAIKRLYQAQLIKTIKQTQRPIFVHYYQEHLDTIELNRVIIPFSQQIYGLSNIGNCISKSLLYQAMRRFQKQKEYLRIQIETFLKFNKSGGVEVVANYFQLPHLADLNVTINNQSTAVLFRSYEGEPNHFLNYKQAQMQRESELYWRKKGFSIAIIRCEKDVQEFMKKITKQNSGSGK